MNNYIKQLNNYLRNLTKSEREAAVQYYQEMMMDRGIETYEQATKIYGTPKQLAMMIKSDLSLDEISNKTGKDNTVKHGKIKTVWIIILALISIPVLIPFALAVIFSILGGILLIGVVAVMGIIGTCMVLAFGAVTFLAGVGVVLNNVATGLAFMGAGLLAMAISSIIIILVIWIVYLIGKWCFHFIKWVYQKAHDKVMDEGRTKE